jgi:hypothetical protein
MDDITLNLLTLAVLAVTGGLIFFYVRRRKKDNELKIIQLAGEHGWTCQPIREPLAWGLRLKSAQWTLETTSRSNGQESGSGSTNIAKNTLWRASLPGGTFLIGGRTSQANLGSLGDMLVRKVLQLALGPGADQLTEVHLGSETFLQKYMFWADDPVEAEKLLSPRFESALLAWKGEKPLIKRISGDLTIELAGLRLDKWEDILALVQLGEMLLDPGNR